MCVHIVLGFVLLFLGDVQQTLSLQSHKSLCNKIQVSGK